MESIDELLRHDVQIPPLAQFQNCILFIETLEEIPEHNYVFRVLTALGERGILQMVKALLA